MELFINGSTVEIPFTFKAIKAAAKLLGSQKLSELEKTLSKVGYDNCHKVAHAMIATTGESVSEQAVEDAIEDANFPIKLVENISNAIAGPDRAKIVEIESAAKGN